MFSTSDSLALCRVSQIAFPAGRHVLFDVTQIYRTVLCGNGHQGFEKSLSWLWREPRTHPGVVWLPRKGKEGRGDWWGFMHTELCTDVYFPCFFQLTPEFSQRLCCKIHELLSVMENGLKSADPRDCTSYTGWAGQGPDSHTCQGVVRMPINSCCCSESFLQQERHEICIICMYFIIHALFSLIVYS